MVTERESRGNCVASYRIDMTAKVWPFLVPATVLMSLGALGVCMAFVTHGPFAPYGGTITLAGGACILAGLILGSLVAKPVLTHDEYVAALEKGLLLKVEKEEKFVPWGDIESIRWDTGVRGVSGREDPRSEGAGGVVIRMREGEPVVLAKPFGTAKGEDVASRLDDVRRKAGFDLL